jgi:hypothetical protein
MLISSFSGLPAIKKDTKKISGVKHELNSKSMPKSEFVVIDPSRITMAKTYPDYFSISYNSISQTPQTHQELNWCAMLDQMRWR